MREFVRVHPWRLEIVPALAFIVSIGAALFYAFRLRETWNCISMPDELRSLPATLLPWLVAILLSFWAIELHHNHRWVETERRKRYNWVTLLFQVVIVVKATLGLALVSLVSYVVDHRPWIRQPWPWLAAILVLGIVFEAVMEKTRTFAPTRESPEPGLSGDTASAGEMPYVDMEIDWWPVASAVPIVIATALLAALTHMYYLLVLGLIGGGLMALFGYRRVAISRDGVLLSCWLIRKRFRIGDIIGCRAVRPEAWERVGPKRARALFMTTGRCLELTTRDGKTHVFGMVRPSYACSLLEPLISGVDA